MTASRSILSRIVGLALVATTMALGLTSTPSTATTPSAAMLAEDGTISGSVAPVEDFSATVYLYRWYADLGYFDYFDDQGVSGDNLSYSFTAPAGDYFLILDPYDSRWVPSWSGGASEPPVDLSSPGVIHVEPGQSVTADLTAVPNPAFRQVTGTVVDGDANPQEGVYIELWEDRGDGDLDDMVSTETDGDGGFSFLVLPADYLLEVQPGGAFENARVWFTVEDDDVALDPIVVLTVPGPPASGIVTDQWGRPIQGVQVTLLRSETQDGTYTVVPDGSTIMSESNRANPSFTDTTGYFRWDVQPGWHKVRAETAACATQTTPAMEVPPERVDLLIKLACIINSPTPSAAPSVSGVAQVGKTIRPTSATWPAPLQESSLELLRNGTPVVLVSGGYTLTTADIGARFTARSMGQRPDYVQEHGTGSTVTFSPAEALSGQVTGAPAVAPPPPGPNKKNATITLKAPKKATAGKKTKITATITVTGAKPTGKVTLRAGKKAIGTITLKAKTKGVATFTVKLKPGKHKLSATYAGSPTINPATSTKVTVKVTKPKKKAKRVGVGRLAA